MSRKLDVAVAEALGYEVKVRRSHLPCYERYCIITKNGEALLPRYSTDGNAMLELDNEMRERGLELRVDNNGRMYAANYYNLQTEEWLGFVAENTMSLAVALAAYKALTGKEWQERECLLS